MKLNGIFKWPIIEKVFLSHKATWKLLTEQEWWKYPSLSTLKWIIFICNLLIYRSWQEISITLIGDPVPSFSLETPDNHQRSSSCSLENQAYHQTPQSFKWRPHAFHWGLHMFHRRPQILIKEPYNVCLQFWTWGQGRGLQWKAWGLQPKAWNLKWNSRVSYEKFVVSNENLGVSNEKLGVFDDKLVVSNENLGSLMIRQGSPIN